MKVPNLKELAASLGYRSYTSETYFAETGSDTNRCTDPWHFEMRGAKAVITPWGNDLLAVCTKGRSTKALNLLKEPWVVVERSQIGDDGCNLVFPANKLEEVCKYFKFYKKRVMTEEQRKVLSERAKKNFNK
tara:strand:+ start:33 stop:428 length:396 start_codon:yes stop_codon:yes gene_type:complete